MNTSKFNKKLLLPVLIVIVLLSPSPSREKAASEEYSQAGINHATPFVNKMEVLLRDERLAGAIVGVSIRKVDNGDIVYSSFGDTRLHPASNMKLLTAAAAFEKLGPEYQFTTEVWTDGEVKGSVLQGDVYLRGKGDPTLMKADLDQFAKDLKAKGIQIINGNLVGDDSWYDDIRLSQDLNWSDESNPTGAQISGLTLSPDKDYNAGTVIVKITPASKQGERAQIELMPATNYLKIIDHTVTVDSNEPNKLTMERIHGTNQIIVKGTMPLNGKLSKSTVSVWEPAGYVLDVFKKSLQENGVELSENSALTIGVKPVEARLLTAKKSMPLKDLLIPFMKLSNNGHGETLTKEMGKVVYGEGSWEKGLQVIKETVTTLGVEGDTIMLRDGSGMSHKNMIPANELTQLLYIIQGKSWFELFENSLPVAGISDRLVGGTLRFRLNEEPTKGNVKAKTGSITAVSTISGYLTTMSGEKLIFSIMINNQLSPSVGSIEDAIIKTLAEL